MSFGFSTKSDSEEDLESRCYYVVTAKIQYRAVALDSCSPVVCSLVKTRFNRETIFGMPILISHFSHKRLRDSRIEPPVDATAIILQPFSDEWCLGDYFTFRTLAGTSTDSLCVYMELMIADHENPYH